MYHLPFYVNFEIAYCVHSNIQYEKQRSCFDMWADDRLDAQIVIEIIFIWE